MRKSRPGRRPPAAAIGSPVRPFPEIDLYIASLGGGLVRHSRNVAWLAGQLCDSLGIAPTMRERIVASAYSHDIGKALLPVDLIEKTDALTADEHALLRRHAARGAHLLRRISAVHHADLSTEIETALLHHERWDGSGYPRALSGMQIPLPSRIVAVVDVYDALVSVRPYKPAWSHDRAIDFIRKASGSHFDPRCATAFLELAGRLPADWMMAAEAEQRRNRKRFNAASIRRRRGPLLASRCPRSARSARGFVS